MYLHNLMVKELERTKIDLVLSCLDFNLFDAFRILDLKQSGSVSESELYQVF
jgi:hypothetical protein